MRHFKVDYLLVGSGAMGMAFADILLAESDASVLIVDRYHQPGGHWTVSYPFVQLHQPSAFYGVNSVALGGNQVYATGWNRGLYELATKKEITSYFDQVMQRKFLPSGRVKYFPSCQYLGDGRFESGRGPAIADRIGATDPGFQCRQDVCRPRDHLPGEPSVHAVGRIYLGFWRIQSVRFGC